MENGEDSRSEIFHRLLIGLEEARFERRFLTSLALQPDLNNCQTTTVGQLERVCN